MGLKGVRSFQYLSTAEYITYKDRSIKLRPFFINGKLTDDGKSELEKDFYLNSYLTKNGKNLVGSITLNKNLEGAKEKQLMADLLKLSASIEQEFSNVKVHLLGHKVAKYYFLQEMLNNQRFISPLIFLILSLLIFWLFRSLAVVIWVDLIIAFSYCLAMILIFLLEGGLNPYSGLALTFVIIVATADLIHYFSIFLSKKGNLQYRLESTKKELWKPCLLTTLTTSISFLSLIVNDMQPVRFFGLYCSFGAFVAFILTFYFLPKCLSSFPREYPTQRDTYLWLGEWLLPKLQKWSYTIMAFFFISFIGMIFLSTRVIVDDDFYDKFTSDHPMARSFVFFNDNFHYVSSVDLVYSQKTLPLSKGEYQEIKEFEEKVLKIKDVSKLSSFISLREYLRGVAPEFAHDGLEYQASERFLKSMGVLKDFTGLKETGLKTTVFLKTASIKDVRTVVTKLLEFAPASFNVKVRGFINIRSFLYDQIINNFLFSFALSFIFIFIIFLLIFRSFSWAALALIPNIFPIVVISAMMGLLDIKVEGNVVMLICVVMGVAVDDTIHFLYTLRAFKKQGLELMESIRKSYEHNSKALIGTTLVFIVSFPCFLLSDLKLMVQMGAFIILALGFALIADFVLLPVIFLCNSSSKKA